jgi:hypothetical protein
VERRRNRALDRRGRPDERHPMTMRTLFSRAVAGLAAAMLSLPVHAGYVWKLDGDAALRVDVDTGDARAAGGSGPIDAFVPLADGGAWLTRGGELVRLAPDLGVSARTTVVASGPMHWEPRSRQLWVAAERDLLRYDEQLHLLGITRLGEDIRGLAGSGPDAIFVATDTRLVRVNRDGEPVGSADLPGLGGVRGVLADTARARVWIVGSAGTVAAFDVGEGLRSPFEQGVLSPSERAVLSPSERAVLSPSDRVVLSPNAAAVTVEATTGSLLESVDGLWRRVGTMQPRPGRYVGTIWPHPSAWSVWRAGASVRPRRSPSPFRWSCWRPTSAATGTGCRRRRSRRRSAHRQRRRPRRARDGQWIWRSAAARSLASAPKRCCG